MTVYPLKRVFSCAFLGAFLLAPCNVFAAYFPLGSGANVGIGMTAPQVLLHVGSAGTLNNVGSGDMYIQNDLEIDGILYGNGSNLTNVTQAANGWTDSGTIVRLTTATDNVGIGTTAPEAKLEVQGAEGLDAGIVLDADDGDDAADTWTIKAVASDNQLKFLNDGNVRMILDSSGNVGIGDTVSPLARLHVVQGDFLLNNNSSFGFVDVSAAGVVDTISLSPGDNYSLTVDNGPPINGSMQFYVDNATGSIEFINNAVEKMRITNAGNVGIGTSAPQQELDVEGELEFNIETTNDTTIGVCKNTTDGTSAGTEFRECNGAHGDIAEWYEAKEGVGAGDVVSLTEEIFEYEEELVNPRTGLVVVQEGAQADEHGNYQPEDKIKVKRKLSVLDKATPKTVEKSIGVVSTSPYQSFGKSVFAGINPQPIALIGRVPTKVSLENGEIEIGDLITISSQPGVGMKATQAGRVVGYALEPFKDSGVGQTMVFINPHWWGGKEERDSISQRIEYFETAKVSMPYQLVSIDENQKIKPAKKRDALIIGVVGEGAVFKDRYPVILGGRAKARVRGRVQFGDRLTASMEEGLLEKAKEGEDVLATALESGSEIVEVVL